MRTSYIDVFNCDRAFRETLLVAERRLLLRRIRTFYFFFFFGERELYNSICTVIFPSTHRYYVFLIIFIFSYFFARVM